MQSEIRIKKRIADQIMIAEATRKESIDILQLAEQQQQEIKLVALQKKFKVEQSMLRNGVPKTELAKQKIFSSKIEIVQDVKSRRQLEMAEELDYATNILKDVEQKELEAVNRMKYTQRKQNRALA